MSDSYPPDVREYVKSQLQNGTYKSEDELIAAAVRMFRLFGEHYRNLKDDIQRGIAGLNKGKGKPWNVADLKSELGNQLNTA